jgi:hypothetical protein
LISRFDLDQRVREWSLREDVVEKDYVLGWVLWGIGSDEVLSTLWAFKGGTCPVRGVPLLAVAEDERIGSPADAAAASPGEEAALPQESAA